MIRQAILYVPDTAGYQSALLRVAGRAIVFRALMTALRAGVTRIGVPARLRSALGESPVDDAAARASIEWLDPGTDAWVDAPTLLLPAVALLEPRTIGALLAAASEATPVVLEESKGAAVPVVVAPPR